MRSALGYQFRRHPFIIGTVAIVFAPYILGFVLVIAALVAAALILDAVLRLGR